MLIYTWRKCSVALIIEVFSKPSKKWKTEKKMKGGENYSHQCHLVTLETSLSYTFVSLCNQLPESETKPILKLDSAFPLETKSKTKKPKQAFK